MNDRYFFAGWPFLYIIAALLLMMLVSPLQARAIGPAQKARIEKMFERWKREHMGPIARQAGISLPVLNKALAPARLVWSLPDLLPPGLPHPRKKPVAQSEFRSPGRYFRPRHLLFNIREGRRQLGKWSRLLRSIERRYGVPGEIIIAIWGKETAFGRARLPFRAIDVLASQAFMGRRQKLFEKELIAALKIVQAGHISPAAMKSAWAGALGHPQFMPSAFLKYAVDFDGDGRKDIWRSVPDALASIANFLSRNGWQRGRRWGWEIVLPENISCTLEGPDQDFLMGDWVHYGVRRIDGRPFPRPDLDQPAFLLLPAGRMGPAFLVSHNFYVLKSYNESDVYALLIGHVADRLKAPGRPRAGFRGKWLNIDSFSRHEVMIAQKRLERHGIDVGGADGLIGYKTRIAIGNWQQAHGKPARCFPTRSDLSAIR